VEGRKEEDEELIGCIMNEMNDEMMEIIKIVEEK
jgi:hypothetical protein